MHEVLGSVPGISSQKSGLEGMISREFGCQLGYCISDIFLSISMACKKMDYIPVFPKWEKSENLPELSWQYSGDPWEEKVDARKKWKSSWVGAI